MLKSLAELRSTWICNRSAWCQQMARRYSDDAAGHHDRATRQPSLGFLIWINAVPALSSQIVRW